MHGCMCCAWFGVHVEGARGASKGGQPPCLPRTPCHVTLCHAVPIVCVVTSFADQMVHTVGRNEGVTFSTSNI